MNTSDIARIVHEANRALCVTQGDFSLPSWDDAPEWQRSPLMSGIDKTRSGIITSPEESHQSWLDYKAAEGWVYGEKKDPEAKTHPCMVPYDQLPASQKLKDHLFQAIVGVCLKE